ncbi:MAG: ABC transporter permease [Geminicoccaceae bacterium]|jgi:lipoprotein-releasing system permease protein|nr:ABC transporter permease [Geminicoccaceae bacterium]MCB9966335.1 ABC transporter permease [Geminicoccaceae bacterium]HRY25600.1 ABC transporter permease [Geminicoccaceae bacterium]
MRLLLAIALTHIAGRGRQTIVSILGVALGVGFSIAMAALMVGSQRDFTETLIDAVPHVRITDETRTTPRQPASEAFAAVAYSGLRPVPDPRGILNPTRVLAGLRSWVDGSMVATLQVEAVVRFAGIDMGVALMGVEPLDELRVSTIAGDMTTGRFEDLIGAGFAVIIGERLAERLGAGINDLLTITVAGGNARQFKVTGLFRTGSVQQDERVVYTTLKRAQVLANRPEAINEIRIRLADIDSAPLVAARAEAMLGIKSVSWQESSEDLLNAFEIRNVIMFTVVGAILLVAGFGIFNIVSIITHEKARDIAILKSIGFPPADIRGIFLFEGLVMGGSGALLGCLLGFGLTEVLGSIAFEFRRNTELTHLPVVYEAAHYVMASALAMLAAGIAGYLPARSAARLNPVDIIRGAT